MNTRLLVVTSVMSLASLAFMGCGGDDDDKNGGGNGGSGAQGGSSTSGGSGGSSSAGTSAGGTGGQTTLACGPKAGAPEGACADIEDAYTATYDDRTLGAIASACGRNECIGELGKPGFSDCVKTCIDRETNDAIAANDCSACVVITVECGGTACIGQCLADRDVCGPNGDQSCCDECLCNEGAYDALSQCTGIANSVCAPFNK